MVVSLRVRRCAKVFIAPGHPTVSSPAISCSARRILLPHWSRAYGSISCCSGRLALSFDHPAHRRGEDSGFATSPVLHELQPPWLLCLLVFFFSSGLGRSFYSPHDKWLRRILLHCADQSINTFIALLCVTIRSHRLRIRPESGWFGLREPNGDGNDSTRCILKQFQNLCVLQTIYCAFFSIHSTIKYKLM